jgi:hypothetical protein
MGVADYPIEVTKMVKADRDVAKTMATDFALDSGKGLSRIVGAGLKAPMEFTHNISKGFGNVPKLYGDETVRKDVKVTGLASGLSAAGKVCSYGIDLLLDESWETTLMVFRGLDLVCSMESPD